MARRSGLRTPLPILMTVIVLLACSATGLLAGVFARALASGQPTGRTPSGPVISGTPPGQGSATPTLTPAPTITPLSSDTTRSFTLSLQVAPRTTTAGDTLAVTVVATSNGVPVSGLTCELRAPKSGPPGLLTAWPTPVSTDATGTATWTLTAPSVAPGTYGIEVYAENVHHYNAYQYVTVTVR